MYLATIGSSQFSANRSAMSFWLTILHGSLRKSWKLTFSAATEWLAPSGSLSVTSAESFENGCSSSQSVKLFLAQTASASAVAATETTGEK